MSHDIQTMLAAVAEPTRFRIVQLLATRACTVGEVAAGIGALQPQTTKHLQTLETAGIVRIHKLGRRRVARLDRDALSALAAHFGALARPDADDAALDAYEAAVRAEESRGPDGSRSLTFTRTLPASATAVWDAWVDPERAARWWAPRHFQVDAFEIAPRAGAPVRLALREAGAVYESAGHVEEVEAGRRLVFSLAPVDADGVPLFAARHTLTLDRDAPTVLTLRIDVSEMRPEAAPAVAGLEPGWKQLLDALEAVLEADRAGRSDAR